MTRASSLWTGSCLLAVLLVPTLSPAQTVGQNLHLDVLRLTYSQALTALRKGQDQRFRELLPKLQTYPLRPYLEYWYLVQRLKGRHDQEIETFITRHYTSHLGRRLQNAWLRSLFRRHHYRKVIEAYQPSENVSLQCLYVRSHIRLKHSVDELQPLIRSIWLHGKSRPKICDPLLKWFQKNGLSKDLVWQRIALSMEHGNTRMTRYLKRFLPPAERTWVDLWVQIHRRPARYLQDSRLKAPKGRLRKIAVHGIVRLSRNRPEKALSWLQRHHAASSLNADELSQAHYHIALNAASKGLPIARSLLAEVPPHQHTDAYRHLRLRWALLQQDWSEVLAAAQHLPNSHPFASMSLYWQVRALEQLGRPQESVTLAQELAGQRGYYGFLMAERLGQPYAMNFHSYEINAQDLKVASANPSIQRAHEFYFHGDINNAREEWNDLMHSSPPRLLNNAAVLAHGWGWHEGTIRSFGRSRYFDDLRLRFPVLYESEFLAQAKRHQIDPALLYAVTRRESTFAADTRSPAGAIGLMQLMPRTAQQVARSLKIKKPNTQALKKPVLNIQLGSQYMASMLKKFDGNQAMALAAYNAGPTAVKRWRPKTVLDGDIWVETIPYKETRQYVRTILEYAAIYQWRTGQLITEIWPRIHPIRPH